MLLKYRASFFYTSTNGIFYKRIIYGRSMDDLQTQINEIQKTGKVEDVRFFELIENTWEQQ